MPSPLVQTIVPAPPRRHASLSPLPPLSRWQEQRAKALLSESLGSGTSIADVARACRLSRSYFGRVFKRTTGASPQAWLTAQRVASAQQLLLQDRAVLADVAQQCGFADQSHFTRVFRQVTGLSPGAWRREQA